MTELLTTSFYLGVLGLVIGCGVYLFVTRSKPVQRLSTPELSAEVLQKAERLGGRYHLSDLEHILVQLASIEAWGVVLELQLKAANDIVQAIVNQNSVELTSHNLGGIADHFLRFRRAAEKMGLELHLTPGEKEIGGVEIAGSWQEIASTMIRFIDEVHNLGSGTEIDVVIFC